MLTQGIHGVMVVVGNGHSDQSSNLVQDYLNFHRTNTLRKGMHQTILPPAMGK